MIVRLHGGGASVAIDLEAGGRLSSLRIGGRERLIAEPDPDSRLPSISWGSFVMAPWVGRLRDGRITWGDAEWQVPRNLAGHAIHGATFDVAWRLDAVEPSSATLSCDLRADRWPFHGRVVQRIALAPGALDQAVEIVADRSGAGGLAAGTSPPGVPVAIGWHPWFTAAPADHVAVRLDAAETLETTDDLIPTGRRRAVDAQTDLRPGAELGMRRLDHAYLDVRSPALIRWPDLDLALSFGGPVSTAVVHSPAGRLCVEPQTAWPDAIRLAGEGIKGTGLAIVEPGGSFTAATRWTWTALD